MFCPACGTENPDDARFCGSCGASLQVVTKPPEPPEPPMKVLDLSGPEETVSDGLKYGVMAASLLIPFIGIGMGIYYLVKGESESKKSVGRLWLYVAIGILVLYMAIGGGEV